MEDDAILEARKKAKRSGEEDPLVVAQRFLNIYRQIHIFSPDKKESFNKMVLELPPEIRGMFGQLPGGILLQEYVDELAEQRGIEKSIHTSAETQNLEETDSKQAKILATALAQAQVQASAQMQAMGMSPAAPIATNA
ncbi:MAG: hypothetical protein IKL33_03010, partial [Alphaproteobacteria bacterium]|nr:hypothetical protein [Alphaproteobacteria bacterium]